jgi:hypothetical protein
MAEARRKNGIASSGKESIPFTAFCATRRNGVPGHKIITRRQLSPKEIAIGTDRRNKAMLTTVTVRMIVIPATEV